MTELLPTLRRRVALTVGSLVLAALSLSAIGIWGVVRIHADSGAALRGYRQLREVYEIGVHLDDAKQTLQSGAPDRASALRSATLARTRLEVVTVESWLEESKPIERALHEDLQQIGKKGLAESIDAADRAIGRVALLAAQVRANIELHEASAAHEKKATLIALSIASSVIVLIALLVLIVHYRSVMGAIDRLSRAVRRFASGRFDKRIEETRHAEFASLGHDLNHMANELDALYSDLERKVAEKSRELVRSERLASVGYLGAGVAHEINNPLGIIAAYGERALQRLRRSELDAQSREQIEKAFTIICDEAFRAKEITDRLLTLVRPGDESRRPVSIAALAQEVIATVAGLPQFAQARLMLECSDAARDFTATVNDTEIKQVLLNLLVNAIESFSTDDRGNNVVRVTVGLQGADAIEVAVSDTGRGMDEATLGRVFEPFFSRRKDHRAGTGLGLSICHAIIESHRGRLTAESDGPGQGSRFTVSLPLVMKGAERAHA